MCTYACSSDNADHNETQFQHNKESAVQQLEENLSKKTNEAVSEGKNDVESAKAAGASYLDQAKNLANNIISNAQVRPHENLIRRTGIL